MKRHGMRVLGLALALLASPVPAQEVTLEPSPAQRCLQPALAERGEPEYPALELKHREGGRVKVELSFTKPDTRPEVKVLEGDDATGFVAAVKAHVRSYRVPCMEPAQAPERLVIEFVFQPDDRKVTWMDSADADQRERRKMLACLQHSSGKSRPEYPAGARRRAVQGRVLLVMHFDAPDKPPRADVHARPEAKSLADEIRLWADGYRLPCHSGGALGTSVQYNFRFEDEVYGFKSATFPLLNFLGAMRGLRQQRVSFDFNTMNCPFEVTLAYRQPYRRNRVGQVGEPHPARQALLEWLAGLELNLPDTTLDAVWGDEVTLTVPCTKINLTPKE